jgi:hypothetical protein
VAISTYFRASRISMMEGMFRSRKVPPPWRMWTSPIRESFCIASRTETALIPYSRVIFSMDGSCSPAASFPWKIRSRMVRTRLSPTFLATRPPEVIG